MLGDVSSAVRLLEQWLPDVQPAPRVQRLGSVSGPAPMRKHECPDCGGHGRDRFKRQCKRCQGRCWVHWDDYTDGEVGHADTSLVSQKRWVTCPHCCGEPLRNNKACHWCDDKGGEWYAAASTCAQAASASSGRPGDSLGVAAEAGHAVTDVSLWSNGSFAALEAARSRLGKHATATQVHWEIVRVEGRVRVPAEIREWERSHRLVANGTGRHANGFAQRRRNAEIRRLRTIGLTSRAISVRFGVSEATVSRVLSG